MKALSRCQLPATSENEHFDAVIREQGVNIHNTERETHTHTHYASTRFQDPSYCTHLRRTREGLMGKTYFPQGVQVFGG